MLTFRYYRAVLPSSLCLRQYSTVDASAIARLKNPTRGGQNLSLRYRRLEQSLRGKEALQRDIRARESDLAGGFRDPPSQWQHIDTDRYFHGFEIPLKPKPPESDGAFLIYRFCASLIS
jgi:hypothetical protein